MQNISTINLGFSTRTRNSLMSASITTLEMVMSMTEDDLKNIKNMGAKSIQEVLDFQVSFKNNSGNLDFSTAGVVKIDNLDKPTVLEIAHPNIVGKKIKQVRFIDNNGVSRENINISEIDFSIRTINCLVRGEYDNILEVANEEYDKLLKIRNLGLKSASEIVSYLKQHTDITVAGDKLGNVAQSVLDLIQIKIDLDRYSYNKTIINQIRYLLAENEEYVISIYSQTKNIEDLVNDENFIKLIKDDTSVQKILDCFLLFIIHENKIEELLSIDDYFSNINLYKLTVERLIENKKIEKDSSGKYRLWLPHIDDWIITLSDNYKQAVSMRLEEGWTLEECGQVMNLTRERVRQIVNKAIREKPILRADDSAYWYQEYWYNKESFCMIFQEEEITYNYLNSAYKHGEKPPELMFDDEKLTKTIYSGLKSYINRNSILIGDEYVPCKRENICKKLAEIECTKEDISLDVFWNKYMSFLKDKHIDDNEKLLFPSERAFYARIEDSLYVLNKYGRKFRYFLIEECDVLELVQRIHLEQFKNVEISTLKLFVEYKDVMDEFNVKDEYELHNLLKKTEQIWNPENIYDVKLTRMPFMAFGMIDRARQAEDLLFVVAPVSIEDYCEYYEMEYGVLARTVAANFTTYINNYYHNGMFSINQPIFLEEESIYMKDVLSEDFYFIEDVVKLYSDRFKTGDVKRINPRTLKEIGYRVYTNYILRDKFSSALEYFRKLLLREDIIDLKKQDKRLTYIQIFNNTVDTLRTQYKLIEYEDMKFIRLDRLQSVYDFVTLDLIHEYVDEAIEAANGEKYFTVQYIEKAGFIHLIDNIQLGAWFKASLIKNSRKVRFIKTGGNIVFYLGDRQISTIDFIRHVLKTKEKMDIYEFIKYIKDTYGVEISKDKLTYIIKPTSMYYDAIMEKIYISKDYYYDEI